MSRSRASARAAGTTFERSIADHLAANVDDRIDRAPKAGAKDKGDLANVRTAHDLKLAVECKDTARLELGTFINEAETERINLGAIAGVAVHKRRGVGAPGKQYVTTTVDDLIALLTGRRPEGGTT